MGDEEAEAEIPAVYVMRVQRTPRSVDLRGRQAYLRQTQHDHRNLSWDGVPRDPGVGYMRARLEPVGFVVSNGAPYGNRRPSCPYPIGRQVIRAFTDMVFGASEPDLATPADPNTARYCATFLKAADFWDTLSESRDFAGACGEAAVLLEVIDGEPSSERLNTADLRVVEWENAKGWVPRAVIEQRLVEVEQENEETRVLETVRMWRTRYWDATHSVVFKDVPEDYGKEDKDPPPIPIEDDAEHNAGRCPVVWYQNTRSSKSCAGESDLEGVHETADQMDKLQSMVVRASNANTDPTLVYKDDDRNRRRNPQLRKGYGARIDVGPNGDAKLLETSGSSIETSWAGVEKLRAEILQTTGAVIVTPENASSYKSGKAIQMLWGSMHARCSMRLRVPLENVIQQACAIAIAMGQNLGVSSIEEDEPDGVVLPPMVKEPSQEDKDAAPDNEPPKPELRAHEVGSGRYVEVRWSPYHEPTAEDLMAYASALSNANGAKPLLSKETATRELVNYIGNVDPEEELERIAREHEEGMGEFTDALGNSPPPGFDDTGDDDDDDDDDPSNKGDPEPDDIDG